MGELSHHGGLEQLTDYTTALWFSVGNIAIAGNDPEYHVPIKMEKYLTQVCVVKYFRLMFPFMVSAVFYAKLYLQIVPLLLNSSPAIFFLCLSNLYVTQLLAKKFFGQVSRWPIAPFPWT